MCKSVPKQIASNLLCSFFRRRLLGSFLRRFFFRRDFGGVFLPEQLELLFIFVLKFPRATRVDVCGELDAARLKRVDRPPSDFLIQPDIAAKPAAFALKLLFAFILCHPLQKKLAISFVLLYPYSNY